MKVVEQSERILVQFAAACHVAEFVEAATWCAMQDWNCWPCCRLFVQLMECKVWNFLGLLALLWFVLDLQVFVNGHDLLNISMINGIGWSMEDHDKSFPFQARCSPHFLFMLRIVTCEHPCNKMSSWMVHVACWWNEKCLCDFNSKYFKVQTKPIMYERLLWML